MNLILLDVDLSGQWGGLWSTFKSAAPWAPRLLALLALIMLVFAIFLWILGKRRNIKAGDNNMLIGTILVACLFAAPELVLPLILNIIDGVVNFVIHLADKTVK